MPELSEAQIRAAVEEARLHGAHVAAHAHGAEGIKRAVRAGVHSIEHGSLMDDEGVALMAEAGTWLVADIYGGDYIAAYRPASTAGRPTSCARTTRRRRTQREVFEKCVAAGVRIAYGTDSGIYPHGLNARQLAYHVRHGQTPVEAIRSATLARRRPDGLVGPDRARSSRAVRRPGRRTGRPDARRTAAGGRAVRDEGRRGRPRRRHRRPSRASGIDSRRVLAMRTGTPSSRASQAQRLPRSSCSRSIDSKSALKLPLPKPSEPCRSMNS